jgi:transposase InsO family protein
MCVFTDASDLHWGGVVTQCAPEELSKSVLEQEHQPLAFISGSFHGSQLKWPTVEQEAFAIMETCDRAVHLLQRAQPFNIFTDHRNLTFIFNPDVTIQDGRKQAAERIERWQIHMRGFNFRIHHVSGEDNVLADMISRWAAPSPIDTNSEIALAVRRRHTHITPDVNSTFAPEIAIQFNVADAPSEEDIIAAQTSDQSDLSAYDLHKDVDGVLNTAKGQMFVPDKDFLRLRLCIVAHQGPAGHRGINTTTTWITQRFWWPTVDRDIAVFCRTCLQCQYTRGGKTVPRPLLDTFHASRPNQQLHFDFMHIRQATTATQFQYVLVIMDGFSKFVRLTPCTNATADVTVQALMEWFSLFGICHQFVSDQGTHFLNDVMILLQQRLTIQHHFTAAYAPWSNGQVERVNREIRELLTAMLSEGKLQQDAWVELLPLANFVINNTPSRRLANFSPIEVFTGHKPTSPLNVVFRPEAKDFSTVPVDSDTIKAAVQQLQHSLHDIHHKVSEVKPRRHASRPGETPIDFDIGDYVLISRTNEKGKDKTKNLWSGPARVIRRINDRRFEVINLINGSVTQHHAEFIKRYADKHFTVTKQLRNFIAHGGGAATINRISNHRLNGRQWELLVCWQGYPEDEATWEPISSLNQDAPVITKRYIHSVSTPEIKKKLYEAIKAKP